MKVLVVEDEVGISRTLDAYLRRDGFDTEVAATGTRAVSLFRAAQPDLVLLDVMLPELDGFEVLKIIRRESDVPVIMLTARSEEVDRLVGLGLGADDYIVKPFSFREVMARVKAVLRRSQPAPERSSRPLTVGRLVVDREGGTALFDGGYLPLTATEFRLLATLASAPGRVFSRAELIERALPESDILERTLDSHVKNLRRKLGAAGAPKLLTTVRGMGFRLVEEP
ncbi:MAG: response regulator transcription factor [Trueperaceae bacterium]|nr:response regulator transcription factor [Trueperaceae bacterium]HRQ09562.1 response regulator transcription factor [Trueperaceae bacterium]